MKGVTLPINLIVIIAIAVLVLVVLAAFFLGGFGGGIGTLSLEAAFNQGCATLRAAYACDQSRITSVTIPDYEEYPGDPNKGTYTLADICAAKGISATDQRACAQACGCTVGPAA